METSLVILDVRVYDRDGDPVPGLGRDDFLVWVDGHSWPVEAVDDLCRCGDSGGESQEDHGASAMPGAPSNSADEAVGLAIATEEEPFLFVLFLDFKQLDAPSRFGAVGEARRWVRKVMRPADRAMIFASGRYLERLTSPTSNRDELLAALDGVLSDPDLFDDFPLYRGIRELQCRRCLRTQPCGNSENGGCCWGECELSAIMERQQTSRALTVLRLTLGELAEIPGRKQLIYLNGSGTLFPNRLYPAARESTVGDQIHTAEEVGAAAVAARTAVFSPIWAWSDLVANLADFTGGGELPELEREVRRGCSCLYRVSLKRRGRRGKLQQIRVQIPRTRRTMMFRSLSPTKENRWRDQAQRALISPGSTHAIPTGISLVPLAPAGKGWRVAVELALDLAGLATRSDGESSEAEWGAGVYLTKNHGQRDWKLEKFSKARFPRDEIPDARAVHRTTLELRPGTYQARSYVGDVAATIFGGAVAKLTLTSPKHRTIVGPVLLHGSTRFFLLPLPSSGRSRTEENQTLVGSAPSPLLPGELRPGANLELSSWICTGGAKLSAGEIMRYVAKNGVPAFRVEGDAPRRFEGTSCYAISDSFRLPPSYDPQSSYSYHLTWKDGGMETEALLVDGVPADFPLQPH